MGVEGYAFSGRRTGIGRYAGQLLTAAAVLGRDVAAFSTVLFTHHHDRAAGADVDDLTAARIEIVRPSPVMSFGFQAAARLGVPVPFQVLGGGQDVMLFTNSRRYPTLRLPSMTIVYDLVHLMAPACVEPGFAKRLAARVDDAVRHSNRVGVISEAVANEMRTHYPDAADRLVLLRPGAPESMVAPSRGWRETLQRMGVDGDFVLHVGTVEARKNLGILVSAFRRVRAEQPTSLLLVGNLGWSHEAVLAAVDNSAGRVRHLAFVSDEELRALYAGARLLVFPSRYEGFGLPVLEAMTVGLPVACSDIPVLREVGGTAVTYFDPDDEESIAATLTSTLTDPGRLEAMAEAGRERAADFRWADSARTLVSTLRLLAT